ncbi:cobalamin synthesis protein/P47K family protein [Azoarcus sp. CIB]|uniref:CobW family GTP-binding protein n=1 Tax=Aromatoleum sp. (strain CIB) TaxID=198107 RepID=UPI00067BBAA7|nr:GTP-binding protein [Azoarcus sp. CIB]AKU11479.1 cobalamin synthesis protein/P47K family protein [Azoarcus sp. CIB]
MQHPNPNPSSVPIPVTVLTGFLGAGKTTLLNRILTTAHGHRIAVIENEFGPVNIDSELLVQQSAEVVEMTNGCLCCTVRGDLAKNLVDLKARRDSGELAFDRIVIETTGLADPGPVIQTFFAEPELAEAYLLDAVLTVVDAVHAPRQLAEHPVLLKQIGFADRLLVSKSEGVAADVLDALLDRLARINPRAPIRQLVTGELDVGFLLDIRGFNLNENLLADEAPATPRFRPVAEAGAIFGAAAHSDEIGSLLLEHAGDVDLDRIGTFVQGLLDRHGDDLLRYKGVLAIPGQASRLVFQGVHRLAGFDYGTDWNDDTRRSRIVVIGRRLQADELRAGFAECVIAPC